MTGKTAKHERKSVIALIRVSTLAQTAEDKYGIPAQKEACERIARVNGLVIKWWFQIEDVSGSAVRRSPIMRELLSVVKSGLCDGIVMKEESRLMRRADSEILQLLEANRVKLYLVDAVIDFSNASQKLLGNIKFNFSEYERDLIRERMVGGKTSKRRRGEWHCGNNSVAYGLELYKDGAADRLRVDKKTIDRVVRLFEAFIQGGGFTSFAQLARETGIPYDSIDYILRNEIYTGYHVTQRTADPTRNEYRSDGSLRYQRKREIPVEERERVKMLEDAPISATVFAQAQKLLALRKEMRVKVREGVEDPFLFRGLLRCAECGRRMITISYTNKGANNFRAEYYVCQGAHGARTPQATWRIKPRTCPTRRIRREVLEPILDDIIIRRLANPKFLSEVIAAQADTNEATAEEKLERLNLEIEETSRSIERNQMLFVRGKINQATFDEIDGQLQLELRASRTALEKMRPNLARITPEIWVPIAKQFKQWRKLAQAQKRTLLSTITQTFNVAGYAGKRYHETVVKVKGLSLNLSGKGGEDLTEISTEAEDSIGGSGLVSNRTPMYSGHNSNQSGIYLTL